MGLWSSMKPAQYGDAVPVSPDSYHNDIWAAQAAIYREMWEYFNRDIFDETINAKSETKKYPLGVNLFEQACVNHRACLMGEFGDDVLPFRVKSPNQDAVAVEQALDRIWVDSRRNSMMLQGGLLAEILGGVVFRIQYNPYLKKIYVRLLQPDSFFPVAAADDPTNILECYVAFFIDARTALLSYNVDVGDSAAGGALMTEHWTQDGFEVTVGGHPAYWDRGHQFPMAGPNRYADPRGGGKIVPFEYFPRDRADSFYGIPLGKNILDLEREYNSRAADMGDAQSDSTHQKVYIKNRPKGSQGLDSVPRGNLINLGMDPPNKSTIEVLPIKTSEIPASAVGWMDHLRQETRSGMYSPPVAFGQDEGSQRSALTLSFRMWPMTQSVRTTRGFWGDSFQSLHTKLLIVAATHGGYGISDRHVGYRVLPTWAPMLPRDREGEVNEVVVRRGVGLISVETAIAKLEERDTEWVQAEVERIKADQQDAAKLAIQTAQASKPKGETPPEKPKE